MSLEETQQKGNFKNSSEETGPIPKEGMIQEVKKY